MEGNVADAEKSLCGPVKASAKKWLEGSLLLQGSILISIIISYLHNAISVMGWYLGISTQKYHEGPGDSL